ncbi:hypothetical protein [Rufibacter sp. LB8]|uniref:hypothetical protein n=1 Tax=Rufibacter sp. LB8 TaxID=2777781 RepID=UPI00178C6FF6|nr:hypothetical protein [Rufibacter sp. LB8]
MAKKHTFKILINLIFYISIIFITNYSNAQGFNEERNNLGLFLKRMYLYSPFEGVKVIEDYEKKYLVSVLSLNKGKYPSNSIMMRVAQTKGQSLANTFFNGSTITSDLIIKTTEQKNDSTVRKSTIETIESIKENSQGFVRRLELLTNFDTNEGKHMVFIFFKEL